MITFLSLYNFTFPSRINKLWFLFLYLVFYLNSLTVFKSPSRIFRNIRYFIIFFILKSFQCLLTCFGLDRFLSRLVGVNCSRISLHRHPGDSFYLFLVLYLLQFLLYLLLPNFRGTDSLVGSSEKYRGGQSFESLHIWKVLPLPKTLKLNWKSEYRNLVWK